MGESPQPIAAPPAPPTTPPPATPVEDPFLANLIPEERQVYDLAKWAEENSAEYKGQGLSGKFLNFYKAVDQYITAERQKDPQRTFDDKDEAFQTFVESARPEVEPGKWEKLKTDRLIAQVQESTTKAVTEKFSKEHEEIKKRQTLIEKRPVIEGRLGLFRDNIGKLMTADAASPLAEIAKKIGADGLEKALEADPIFTPIVVTAYNHGERAAAEFLAMTNGVKEYSAGNPVQDWVIRFIRRSGEVFAERGGDRRIRPGEDGSPRSFLPRGKFNELLQKNPGEAEKHWTFSDEDVLSMIERNTKDHIAALVKEETDRLAKAGYVRPPPAPAPVSGTPNPAASNGAPAAPPQPVGSPRAGVSAAPGQGGGTVAQQQAMSDGELTLLGLPRRAA